jgi:hypothetical protein
LPNRIIIESGQKFGECIVTCYQSLGLNNQNKTFDFLAFDAHPNERYNFKDDFSEEDWNEILKEINLKEFYKLNSVFGCPDCADGGAEWISIKDALKEHKVIFDYRSEVKGIEKLILLLRNQRTALSEKYLTIN